MRKPSKRVYQYASTHFNEMVHTTLNPEGPGVVRIHMVPPKYSRDYIGPSVAILNGMDIIPVGLSWSILLAEFICQVNQYSGHELSDQDVENIMNQTCKQVKKVYPLISKKKLKRDIYRIMNTFKQIAYQQEVSEDVGYMSIGDYAPFMQAPHRMDLMVSAMSVDGKWHCNQKCIHCYAANQIHAEEKELSTDEWKKVIDACKAACIPQLTFTGGEPTMREDLVELIDYSRWFVTRLNTNGIKLTKELCQRLREVSLDSMQITFYSNQEAIHNLLVGANQYRATVEGIKNALEANINVSINTPLCTLNKDYVSTLTFLHELGVEYVTCSGLITTGNATTKASEQTQLSQEEIKEVLKEAVEYCFANGMEISFTSPGWIEESYFHELGINVSSCGACLSNMAITPSGNVVPCQSWLSDDPLGNILVDSWESIWNHPVSLERRNYSANMYGLCPLRRERT